ncbi:hypothetical protein GCM10007962_27780 [Yeosuana aromativorans]|uniref:Type IX secretion system PorP/SprF family membrane protein n=1 Tax=Yeosuana aromativorans TaxID=288019 RepID=A0A8J3BRM8_9FLAO|nr:hypothetical protein GCM10007962_27780 [Yeosuana aromativorans]
MQQLFAQEDGVVAFSLPVRNSLTFNKYVVNPTFSFVREQNKYLSFYNKRQWVEFDDAPQTYLFSYAGRLSENTGMGIGLFQQNYGVLTTFGGVLNFAYNTVIDRDSNLTFGLNLGVYKSGLNQGKVVTNYPDPSLDNIPSNFLLTINPGINYGTGFFDFGVGINNLALYNIMSSKLVENNPEQSVQAHVMYTGYLYSRGFFDESKFSGLVRSEFKNDQTVISGAVMLTIPKGLWVQTGYNTLYGMSAGIGFNITTQISMEYNYEKAMGNLSNFGTSHEITMAFKFKNRYRYDYSDEDEMGALISPVKKVKPVEKIRESVLEKDKARKEAIAIAREAAKNKSEQNAQAKQLAETQAKEAEQTRLEAEAKAKAEAEAKVKAKQLAATKAKEAEQARLRAEAKAKAEAAAMAKAEQEAQAKLLAATKAREAEQARLEAEAKAKAEAEAKAKAEQEAQAKLLAETKAREAEQARLEAEAKAKAEQEAKAKEAEQARLAAETNAKAEAAAKAKENLKPMDAATKSLNDLAKQAQADKAKQEALLTKLEETVANREQDLKDLKKENDLSEQGIYTEPKPFVSVSAQNAALESLKVQIDDVINSQDIKIVKLENLYNERVKNGAKEQDSIAMIYLNEILILKKSQSEAKRSKANLVSELEEIKNLTEIERKRRIKRAAYDNQEVRYKKDMAALNDIKQNTPPSSAPLTVDDFDFGEDLGNNIQIVKDVKNEESGYYLVIAVHSDVAKRDDFLRKAVSAGQKNINFFFDVNTSKYYIYYEKFDTIEEARKAMQLKGSKPYNSKMSMVKIEN